MTGKCQPADVAWNKPFKSSIRKQWVQGLYKQMKQQSCDFKLKASSRGDILVRLKLFDTRNNKKWIYLRQLIEPDINVIDDADVDMSDEYDGQVDELIQIFRHMGITMIVNEYIC
jgi:hypothetical protein